MISSIDKALSVMSALADQNNVPITVSKLAEHLSINRSTCSHIIKTLVDRGYAQRVSHSAGYILGPEAYRLSRFGNYAAPIVEVCRPVMNWLHKKTNKLIVLSVIQNDKKYIINLTTNEHGAFHNKEKLRVDDIYRTSTGRIILANMDRDQIKSIYQKYGAPTKNEWEGVDSYETLIDELSKIGKRDIITVSEKKDSYYLVGIGGAIFNKNTCIGAVGIAFEIPEKEYENLPSYQTDIIRTLRKGITEINRRLEYN